MPARASTSARAGVAALGLVGALPGRAAAQPVDPVALARSSQAVRVVGAFLLVLLFGGIVLYRAEERVDSAVDASLESPLMAILYGVFAQVGVVFLGGYLWSQLSRFGGAGALAGQVSSVIMLLAGLTLAGFGLAVVGAGITEAAGDRQLWPGLAIGAGVGASAWLVPAVVVAVGVWVVVVALGIGGSTRKWIHSR